MAFDLKSATHLHFTGLKGVGMTAAAVCFDDLGITVSGSDVAEDFVTAELIAQRNFQLSTGFSPENIPASTDALIYTAAHNGRENPQVKAAIAKKVPVFSQAEAVGQLMNGKSGISICGVGGKSTTAAMLALILEVAGTNPSYLVGVAGMSQRQSPGKYSKESETFIVEADEYAVSPGVDHTPRFMFQTPKIIVCTNLAHDHPDIYPDFAATKNAFLKFFQKVPPQGTIIYNGDDKNLRSLISTLPNNLERIAFGSKAENDFQITSLEVAHQSQRLTIQNHGEGFTCTLKVPGKMNAQNALAAIIAATKCGLSKKAAASHLSEFQGTKRRFEKVGEWHGNALYDDYAHHPSEIKATLKAAKAWFPDKNIIAVFQPHTYSRTKALFSEFTTSFTAADSLIITDIFSSARERIDTTINAQRLTDAIRKNHPRVRYLPQDEIVSFLTQANPTNAVILTLGAGNIYQILKQLKQSETEIV